MLGEIAHIYAFSVDGPRGTAGLTGAQLNHHTNLILLCPTHHATVDGQHETYPATLLLEWKARHERKYAETLSRSISDLGYAELEVAAAALMSASPHRDASFAGVIPPQDKIDKNGLGGSSALLLSMGAAKSREVEETLVKAAQLDPGFPDRLRAGFVDHYQQSRAMGLRGDELFAEMQEWAGGAGDDIARKAAGLCILAHLFILCDVFEK